MSKYSYSQEEKATLAAQRARAMADFSPDGKMPEHMHHVKRRGMGGRRASLVDLETIGVSAQLHARIHNEGDAVLGALPVRPTFQSLF
jgi:hypothetical protein